MEKEDLTRLAKLEANVASLNDAVNKMVEESRYSFNRLYEKLDAIVCEMANKPSLDHCMQNRTACNQRFDELEKKHEALSQYVDRESISKNSAAIFTVLIAIIGILGTLLTIKIITSTSVVSASIAFVKGMILLC